MDKQYVVEYYHKDNFFLIESEWKYLEKGPDMTPYQSYAWYKMLNDCYVPEDTSYYTSVYASIKKNNKTILIAPLWIVKHTFKFVNKKGVYFLGREGWSDYLNFIYFEFDNYALLHLLHNVSLTFHVNKFFFSELKCRGNTYTYLTNAMTLIEKKEEICVALSLPKTEEEYRKKLSKNTRQNIRTAYNRLKKDGLQLRIEFDDLNINRDKCYELREQRFLDRFHKISKLRRYKQKIIYRLKYHFKPFIPIYSFNDGHFLSVYDGDELCSFFYYIYDCMHRQIFVLAAGLNTKYSKYSPGIISLIEFINYHIIEGDIDMIDFTRGDEAYKYALGGEDHFIGGITFKI